LLEALLGADASLEPLKTLLIERTAGNPFFLEESVRTLVEMQVLAGEPGVYRLAQALPTIQVSATVQAVLAARIDRLPPEAKHLLQTAAVIGMEVPLALLRAIAECSEAALHRSLAQLQGAEFLYETRLFPEHEYTLKHALTQQVAYETLLQERRRVLHARIVDALEALTGDRLAEQVERLAHHALRGEVWDKALAYCRQAGAKAAARSGYREAVASFEQALMVVKHLPKSLEILQQTFDLRMELTRRLVPLADYGRILEHLREAQAIAEAQGDPRRLGLVCSHMSDYFRLTGDSKHAVVYGERALAFATELEDFPLRALANQRLGIACYAVGDYWRAIELLKQNVESLQGELMRERFGAGSLPSVLSRSYIVFPLVDLGKFAEAVSIGAEGVKIADESDTTHSQVLAVHSVGFAYLYKGEFDRAIPILERALLRCQVEQIPLDTRVLAATLGYAYALAGRMADAVPLLEQALHQSETLKVLFRYAVWLTWLGEAYLLSGRLEEAHVLAERALAYAHDSKERGNEAYALRLLGEVAAHREPPEAAPAEAAYRQVLVVTNELGMHPLQAHCHRGLGTLYRQTGQTEQARAELSTAIEMYCDMEMTFWLPETEAALAAVEGAS
jgi:tetratricopeptide (TPR) repeat protein